MKKHTLILSVFAFILCCCNVIAQTTETTYYRIRSAKTAFKDYYIEDNSANNNGVNDFLLKPYKEGERRQEWELILKADSSGYYIRNNYSKRYISNSFSIVQGTYYYTQNAGMLSSAGVWAITELQDQVLFSTTDEFGATRFLNATNTTATPERIYLTNNARYTGFAWILEDASLPPTGIKPITTENEVTVSTLNRQIIVSGAENYQVYKPTGEELTPEGTFAPGIYIVRAEGKSFKIIIK